MRILIGLLAVICLFSCKNIIPRALKSLTQSEIIKSDSNVKEEQYAKPKVTFEDLVVKNTVISPDIYEMKTIGGIIFQFNTEENDRLEQKTGANYDQLADDINFYSMGVYNLLTKDHLPVYLVDKRFIRIHGHSSTVIIDTRRFEGIVGWKVLLVDSLKEPMLFDIMELDQKKLDQYFSKDRQVGR